MEPIFKFIVFLRKVLEPVTWKLFKPRKLEELQTFGSWDYVKDLNPDEFSNCINTYKYKSDLIGGLLDYSAPIDYPEYFFKDLPYGRDCDDWSRVWASYYINRGQEVQEWVITSKLKPFRSSHFVAVVKEDEGYRLLNYKIYPSLHSTPEEAIEDISDWNGELYHSKNRMQCLYKVYRAPEDIKND